MVFSIVGICVKKNETLEYNLFKDIPKNPGVYSWLPDFFPTTARNIIIFTDVDSDSFYSDFNLDEKSSKIFDDIFTVKASSYGVDYLSKSDIISAWCKEGDFIDDENKNLYNSLYLIAKLSKNKYHISLVVRGKGGVI